jgi:hypothetical protein
MRRSKASARSHVQGAVPVAGSACSRLRAPSDVSAYTLPKQRTATKLYGATKPGRSGRDVDRAVRVWLTTANTRIRCRVTTSLTFGGQSATGALGHWGIGALGHYDIGVGPRYEFLPVSPSNKLRGLQFASELYRLSDRHLSAKFSANFCG